MTRNEIYKEYLKTLNERIELESKIEAFVEKWQNGEISLSEASKLTHDVSVAFDYYNVPDENTRMIHK